MARFSVAAYAVIREERGRVLLTRRSDGDDWVLPDGTVEAGEPPWDAVVREVREERGLEVEVERLAGIYVKKRETDLVFGFAVRVVGGELKTSDERDALTFFPPGELPEETSDQDRAGSETRCSTPSGRPYASSRRRERSRRPSRGRAGAARRDGRPTAVSQCGAE